MRSMIVCEMARSIRARRGAVGGRAGRGSGETFASAGKVGHRQISDSRDPARMPSSSQSSCRSRARARASLGASLQRPQFAWQVFHPSGTPRRSRAGRRQSRLVVGIDAAPDAASRFP
jgi:hypothetical protein